MGMFDTIIVNNVKEINLDEVESNDFQTKDLGKMLNTYFINNNFLYVENVIYSDDYEIGPLGLPLLKPKEKNINSYNYTGTIIVYNFKKNSENKGLIYYELTFKTGMLTNVRKFDE